MRRRSITRERWSVLEPLLDAALELEPAKRAAFVDKACQRDPVLRSELKALIVACERGDEMLSAPAAVALAPLLAEPAPPLPAMLGDRYYIVREIGRGGMATVYLADDPKHGRQVAVKVLHHEIARVIGRERFLREIEIAASLSHPHILPLHDSGEAQAEGHDDVSFLYFVSPFVAGESLRDRLRREPQLATEEAVRLGRCTGRSRSRVSSEITPPTAWPIASTPRRDRDCPGGLEPQDRGQAAPCARSPS
jgi:eukaryotic-like serine/threonine-protein kinase